MIEKTQKQSALIHHGIAADPVPVIRTDVWVYQAQPGRWTAIMPALEGAKVEGFQTAEIARGELSAAIGRIVVKAWGDKVPVPWLETSDFTPPEGAIKRRFSVSA